VRAAELVRAVDAGEYSGRLRCKGGGCPGPVLWVAERRRYRCRACSSEYSTDFVISQVARWENLRETIAAVGVPVDGGQS